MKIDKIEVHGIAPAIQGSRNPLNSWDKSDSFYYFNLDKGQWDYTIGEKDLNLAQRLILAGNEHGKFLRQIQVWANIDMPRYWWSEMDTYSFNTKNSCSTMHKLFDSKTEITLDMFEYDGQDEDSMLFVVEKLNMLRNYYFLSANQAEKDQYLKRAKTLLPEGFLQKRSVNTNYAELRNIYFQRVRNPHRLKKEWVETFGDFIKALPYAKELIMIERINN